MKATPKAPFLVLTLRRTGGTTLVDFMSKVSEFETVEHEPLNVHRTWGAVTSEFRRSENITEMDESLGQLMTRTPNVKHCIETVPLEVTRSLIDRCKQNNYVFFMLTRRSEVDRIMSLMLANATGVWGRSAATIVYPKIHSGVIPVPQIRAEDAVSQARRDGQYLANVLRILRHRMISYKWLIFEELYKGTQPVAEHAREISHLIGANVLPDDPRLLRLKQGSTHEGGTIENLIKNAGEVRRCLERVCPV